MFLCQVFVLIAVFTAAHVCEIKCFSAYLSSLLSSITHVKNSGLLAVTIAFTLGLIPLGRI